MKKVAAGLCGVLAGVIAQPAVAQDESAGRRAEREQREERAGPDWRLYLTSGASLSTRDFEDRSRTDYYRIPFAARVTRGPLRVSASIPYLVVNGFGPVVGTGGDDEVEDTPEREEDTRRGWGDLRLTGRYRLPRSALAGFELDLLGRVKLPTASRSQRLGTGEVDFALGGELSRQIGRTEPFASVQYRINGDRPDFDYRNTMAASIGASLRLSRRTRASLSYDYSQSRIRGRSGFQSLDAGVSTRLTNRLFLNASGEVGLSRRASDFGVGATLTWRAF